MTLAYIPPAGQSPPDWARFDTLPCEQCTGVQEKSDYCLVAKNIAPVVDLFKDLPSYQTADVTVETRERTISRKQVSTQEALSSLMGIIMVTSGCEDLDRLRPMVSLHLPFASIAETTYRAVSTYLLAQYFRYKRGLEPDWDLKSLVETYRKIKVINASLCQRLRLASNQDANLNAVIILDTFAQMLPDSIEDDMEQYAYLFTQYLD